jgi:hypothetical protein
VATAPIERLRGLRVGYVPFTADLRSPGDRRRFVHWARSRGVPFEIARPGARYDLVVLTQAADLSVWARHPRGAGRVIYDITDAYLHVPATDLKGALRGAAKFLTRQSRHLQLSFRRSIEAMCRRADAVVFCPEELRPDLEPLCACLHCILDVHEVAVGARKTSYAASDPFRLVWEGLPENVRTFSAVAPVLEALARRRRLTLDVVTGPTHYRWMRRFARRDTLRTLQRIVRIPIRLHPWSEEALGAVATAADLAVIPLPLDQAFDFSKPENKLVLFWKLRVPTVTSATPAYLRVMAAAGVAMACRTAEEWEAMLEKYMADEAARREAAERGRAWAVREHGEEMTLRRWDAAVAAALA